MNALIKKLNQLKHTESFIQVHTIKGFRYIDKAGELVNVYHDGNNIPKFSMNLDGLIIEKPVEEVETLKITPTFVWMRFIEISNLGNIARIYNEELKKISSILDIEQVGRVGWRNYFVYEFISQKQEEFFFERIKLLDKTKTEFVRLQINTEENFEGTLMIQSLARADNPQKKAVLFDVDLFQRGEIEVESITQILAAFKDYLQDKRKFLGIINNVLKK